MHACVSVYVCLFLCVRGNACIVVCLLCVCNTIPRKAYLCVTTFGVTLFGYLLRHPNNIMATLKYIVT